MRSKILPIISLIIVLLAFSPISGSSTQLTVFPIFSYKANDEKQINIIDLGIISLFSLFKTETATDVKLLGVGPAKLYRSATEEERQDIKFLDFWLFKFLDYEKGEDHKSFRLLDLPIFGPLIEITDSAQTKSHNFIIFARQKNGDRKSTEFLKLWFLGSVLSHHTTETSTQWQILKLPIIGPIIKIKTKTSPKDTEPLDESQP